MPSIAYLQHQIYYEQYGQGKSLMVAFHGFADKGNLFEKIAMVLAEDYTVLAVDLPFHGQTIWEEDYYRPEDIKNIVTVLMQMFGQNTCSLLCHSMGGRIVLGLLPLMTTQLKQLYFFAPAGFQYTFTASKFWCPLWFRKRARRHFEQSKGMLRFFEITHQLKLMNRATYLVFKQQLDSPKRRARLLKTWVAMYYFPMKATPKELDLLNQHQIAVYFFYGKKDRITPSKHIYKYSPKLDFATITIFRGNHFFVRETLFKPFQNWYRQNNQHS